MIPLIFFVLFPILTATIVLLLPLRAGKILVLLLQGVMIGMALWGFHTIRLYGTVLNHLGGWPENIGITLRADRLAAVMLLLSSLLFTAILLFDFMKKYVNNLFLFLFILLQGLIHGIFLSNDLFNIFVLIEVATIVISVLIMFKKDGQAIYDGMLYFMVNTVAMMFFLFGVGILYKITGVLDMDGIAGQILHISDRSTLILPYAFIITAICLKSAMAPLFSWLPKAHGTPSAPAMVSALLSGLYVKVGIYLFLRIQVIFSPQINTESLFLFIGFMTAVLGFIFAISQKDIKLILAYSTISQVGLIIMALNMGNFRAYWGGIYHIINHGMFKSILFLCAGLIVDEYKTRNIDSIRGVFKRMPLISVAVILAILGITGAPFFNGSLSKYWIAYGVKDSLGEFGLLGINLGTMIIFLKFSAIFFGSSEGIKAKVDRITRYTALALGILCFLGGIFGQQFIDLLFGHRLPIDPVSYLTKVMVFGLTLGVGILIYIGIVKRWRLLHTIRSLELSFNGACLAIALFFGMTVLYLRLVI